ncbi:hypothetical protein GC175_22230 [bacterium]|nr:hypothetical protein [bacterium]
MNAVNTIKMTLAAGFIFAALLGRPAAALADDVIVDGKIITAENVEATSDPEYRYVSVRRTFDAAEDDDHDVLYDPDDDLMPPPKPVGDAVGTSTDDLMFEDADAESRTGPNDAFFVRNDRSTFSQ